MVEESKTWNNAESHCQTYGQHVHLAGLETQEVIIVFLKSPSCLFWFISYLRHKITAVDNQNTY